MKLSRKNLGRVATTFLATAMLASLTAVPAMAADVWSPSDGETTISSIELNKKLTKPTGVPTPDVKFTVSVSPTTSDVSTEKVGSIPVKAGPSEAVKVDTSDNKFVFAYDSNSPTEVAATTVDPEVLVNVDNDNSVTVNFDATQFKEPGIFKYDVTETLDKGATDGDNYQESFTNDSAYLYVYVEEAGFNDSDIMTYKVVNAVLTHTNPNDTSSTGKIDYLTNDYGTKPGSDGLLHHIDLTKKVEGNQGSKDKSFEVTIKVDPSNVGDNFRVVPITKTGDTWTDASTGESILNADNDYTASITLKHGDYVRIYGLGKGDSYTITETDYTSEGYVAYTNTSYEEDDTYNEQGNSDIASGREMKGNTTTDKVMAFHNVRETSAPTGIAMDIAPYALLVVIAAAGCFVFLRKRNED